MRTDVFLIIGLFVLMLDACLVPHRKETVAACRENLWTRGGWGSPVALSKESELRDWDRTQFGIKWAWLVVDREVGGKAWLARVEPRAVWAYLITTSAISAMALMAAVKLENSKEKQGNQTR